MSFSSVIDLCITFVQYFAGLIEGRSDFSVPDSWGQAQQVTEVFSIGIDFFKSVLPSLADFRLYFSAVGVVTPLFFVFLGLGFLNPLRVLLWYILTLAAILLTIVGGLGQILFSNVSFLKNVQVGETVLLIFVIVGPVLLSLCIWAFAKREMLLQLGAEPTSRATTVEKRMEEETESIAPSTLILRFFLSGALIFFGLVFTGVVGGTPFDVNQGGFAAFAVGFGYFFISLGGLLFIYMCIGLFQEGRKLQWKAGSFFEEHFLRLFLILFSILYIPIVSPIFLVFNCNEFSCDDGYRLKDEGSVAVFNNTRQDGLCQQCSVYPNQLCPASLQASICSPVFEDRLESDLTLKCDKVKALFWPAAGAMILCTVIGVPIIFYDLISRSVDIIEEEFPIRDITDDEKQQQEEEERKKKLEDHLDAEDAENSPPRSPAGGDKYISIHHHGSSPPSSPKTVAHLDEARNFQEKQTPEKNHNASSGIVTVVPGKANGGEEHKEEAEHNDNVTDFDPEDPHHKWRLKVIATRNVAKFLYQPFLPTMRYTRLFFLIQKFIAVFLSTFIIRIETVHPTWIQLCSSIGIHFLGLIAVAIALPFMYTFENAIAIIMEVILVATSTLSVLIFAQVSMPNWVLILILICNGVLPVCALIIAIVLEWSSEQSAEEEEEKKKQEELKKEIEAKKQAQRERKEAKQAEELAKKIGELEEAELASRTGITQDEDGSHNVLISAKAIEDAEIALKAEQVAEEEQIKRRLKLEQEKARLVELEKKQKEDEEAEKKRLEEVAAKQLKEEEEAAALKAKRSMSRNGDDEDADDNDDDAGGGNGDDNTENDDNDGDGSADDDDDEMSPEDIQDLIEACIEAGDKEQAEKLRRELESLNSKIGNLENLAEKQEKDIAEKQKSIAYFGPSKSRAVTSGNFSDAGAADDSKSNRTATTKDLTSEASLRKNRTKSVTILDENVPVEVISGSDANQNQEDPEEMRQIPTGEFSPVEAEDEKNKPSSKAVGEEMNSNSNSTSPTKGQSHRNDEDYVDVSSPPPALPHAVQDDTSTETGAVVGNIPSPSSAPPMTLSTTTNNVRRSSSSFQDQQQQQQLPNGFNPGRRRSSLSRQDLIDKQKKAKLNVNMAKFRAVARMAGKRALGKKITQSDINGSPLAGKKKLVPDVDADDDHNNDNNIDASPGSQGSGLFIEESDALFLEEEETGVDYEKDLPENFDELSLEEQLSLRRGIARKKRAKAARREEKLKKLEEYLEKKRKRAAERLLICQENVDFKINLLVKTRLNIFLMIMGLTGLVALALCAIALLAEDKSVVTSAIGSNDARTPSSEFVGYSTWADFTSSCCCTAGLDLNATANNVVEKWFCSNGQIRERLRADKPYRNETLVDGYEIRGLCNVAFANGCTIGTTLNSNGEPVVQVSCPPSVAVSTYQLENLW